MDRLASVADLSDVLARKSEQARAVFYHVRAQRQIANITVERSVELYMVLAGIDLKHFDGVLQSYRRTARDAKDGGYEDQPCKKCPEV